MFLQRRQRTSEYLQAQIFLIAQPVGTSLNHPDLVVQPLDVAQRDFILRQAVSGNAVPVSFYHVRELLIRLEPLPFQTGTPVLEEAPRPAFALVVPQLAEGLFQQVGGVQALVRRQQGLECLPALACQVLPAREQRVLLSLDIGAVLTLEPGVFGLAHLVQRLAKVSHNMKLVEQDGRLRGLRLRRLAERFPHIHHRQTDAFRLLFPEPIVKLRHTHLGTILATEPDRPISNQIADHDTVRVPFAYRDLVDADSLGSRCAGFRQLGAHVLLLQLLDRVPVELQFLGDCLDGCIGTTPAHIPGKALRIERIVRQPVQSFALHLAAVSTGNTPQFVLQIHPRVAAGQVADTPPLAVVPTAMHRTTDPALCFFERRTSVTTRAFGSPKTPRTVAWGRKPGKAYVSDNRRVCLCDLTMRTSCQKSASLTRTSNSIPARLAA